jgi:hypothetical protein
VTDNYVTYKHLKVKAWLKRNPRIALHFTPTSGSWMNLAEIFFDIITPPGHPARNLDQRQRTHQRRGIWTASDFQRNPRLLRGRHLDLARLIRARMELE